MVVCALLHDIGDSLGPWNHSDIAAVVRRSGEGFECICGVLKAKLGVE